ncbi:MAG: glycosyltransferase family A protein [Cyanobacteria bacterium J06648_1]
MKLSIGILAYDESDSIAVLLDSLCQQSIFIDSDPAYAVEIIVVPNGCSDNTAAIARKTLEKLASKSNQASWQWKVCEVEAAGKSNAWNLFVHQFAAPDTDFFYFMDADIKLHDSQALEKMWEVLIENPEYWIALDRPVKDIEQKQSKSWLEKLSVAVSKSSNKGQLYICGQLYCGRAKPLRQMYMPVGLPVEDGFLTQMVITENFTLKNPTFEKRIVRVDQASHVFEAYTNPLDLINHEVRVVVGIVINILLTNYLQEKCGATLTAGMLIKHKNQSDPLWLDSFKRNSLSQNKWTIPLSLVFRRYRSLRNHSWKKALLRLPIATLAFMVDINIFIRANSTLQHEMITSYW